MKTIEEAAIEYAVKESNIDNSKPVEIKQQLYAHELMYAFQAGVEFAQRVEWTPIIGYEGIYEISSHGDVKSLSRKSKNNKNKKEIIISKNYGKNGYYHVGLTDSYGLRKNYDIHRLVATHFIPNSENKNQVNHIDGNKRNNCYLNLEWCTRSENLIHAYKNNLQSPTKYWQGKTGKRHHSSRAVKCIDDGVCFDSIKEAAIYYNTQRCSVSLVCKGILKTTAGRKFEYV